MRLRNVSDLSEKKFKLNSNFQRRRAREIRERFQRLTYLREEGGRACLWERIESYSIMLFEFIGRFYLILLSFYSENFYFAVSVHPSLRECFLAAGWWGGEAGLY